MTERERLGVVAHGHSHGEHAPVVSSRRLRFVLTVIVGVLLVAAGVAVKALWPTPVVSKLGSDGSTSVDYVDATVTKVEDSACSRGRCEALEVRVDSGLDAGQSIALRALEPTLSTPVVEVGDRIVVSRELGLGADGYTYAFAGFQRRDPMTLLGLLFAVIVVGVARWRGLAALVGLALTWLVLVEFLIPAILSGRSPLAVALASSAVIMFVVLYLAHGINARTTTALLGTLASLALTGALAAVFVRLAHLTGITSDEATFIASSDASIDLSGLLLCGIIIGSLGVLNDVTVTQAAAIWEIHAADPAQSVRRLYRAGMRIGRDHIASTVYTLVLAYAGASIPLLILFTVGDQSIADVLTGDIVGEEIVRTLVGSIGLVAAVPLTTLLAALVVAREPVAAPIPTGAVPGADQRRTPPTLGAVLVRPAARTAAAAKQVAARSRQAAGDQRERRRRAKVAKRAEWQAPAAERDFWER